MKTKKLICQHCYGLGAFGSPAHRLCKNFTPCRFCGGSGKRVDAAARILSGEAVKGAMVDGDWHPERE